MNPENSEPPSPPRVACPPKSGETMRVVLNYVIHIPNAFIVFQSIVKFLMYNINIFVHWQIDHDKVIYNKRKP